jgi:predicted nucleotidyltransferase
MGKIFSYSEIEEGRVPTSSDFSLAKDLAFSALTTSIDKGEVRGAAVFGSVAKGTPSERSDFDLLMITQEEKSLDAVVEAFDLIYQRTNVGIEPIIIPDALARRGFHTMDASFYIHLQKTLNDENVVGTNPLDIMVPFDLSLTKVHEQYLIQKLRRLREGIFTHSQADEYRVLQRALEAPINTGRRTLQALHELGALEEPLVDDSKASVKRFFREVFTGTTLGEGFNSLIQQDDNYTTLLRAALAGDISQSEYDEQVHLMTRECIPHAVAWVGDVSSLYIKALEGNKIGIEGRPSYGGKER